MVFTPLLRSPGNARRRALLPVLASAFILAFSLAFAGFARAEGADSSAPLDVLVVEVDESAPAIDALALRAALRRDLHVEAVPPGDPRAARARGAVHVAYDGRTLVVSYRARPEVLTRRIEVPPNASAVERAAVILAGNLARDEGSELAASLRAQSPDAAGDVAADGEAPAQPAPSRAPREGTDAARAPGESDASRERLQRTLDYLADQDHRTKLALAWSCLGLGAAAAGGGAVVLTANNSNTAGWVLALGGGGLALSGALMFLADSPFDALAEYNREHGSADSTEATWERWAQREHSRRRLGGTLALVGSGIALGLATYGIVSSPSSATTYGDWLALIAGVEAIGSIYLLVTDGPVESALHTYERASGRGVWKDGALGHLRLGMVPGGATAGFGAAF